MFLLNLPINIKEQAAIKRRRLDEQKRLSRIFDVKYRTIGIDKAALDDQVKERQYMKSLEKQRNDAFNREMICNDLRQVSLEEEDYLRKHRHAQELNDYRQLYQKPEDAREWDLNDPHGWKKLTPARVSDNDPRLGLSSCQIFAGEDLHASQRKKAQQEQLRHFFNTQIMNKINSKRQQRLANLLYDYKQIELCERSNVLALIETECHRAIELATQNYNEILANETKARVQEHKMKQTEEQLAELSNTAFSDILTEISENSVDYRGRIMIDRWKGMNQEQLADIRHQQLAQIAERQKIRNAQKYFDDAWEQYTNARAKQATIVEQQTEVEKRQLNHCLANENKNLATVQRERQDYLNLTFYRSVPDASFYEQFNTSSR